MKKIRWGILSTAEIARKLTIPAIIRAENAELTAIASLSGSAGKVAEQFDIQKTYDSYEELLSDQDIDAVYIPLPNHMHKEWAIKAAEQKKHILCEKPSSLNAEDTREMVQACEENGVHFTETFTYQYHPQNKRVKEIIQNGDIGEVRLVRSHCSFFLEGKEGNFRLDNETGGGSLYDVGVYSIHTIRQVLGAEPNSVLGNAVFNKNDVEMSSSIIMNFDNGIKGSFDCGMNMTKYMAYEVVGTKGVIQVPRAYQPDQFDSVGLINIIDSDGNEKEETVYGDEQRIAIEHFGDCVLKGEKPQFDSRSSIKNMKVLDACIKAVRSGTTIEVEKQ